MVLRCESGELPTELSQWWENFQNADITEQEVLLEQAKLQVPNPSTSEPGKSKRRRRRGPKKKANSEIHESNEQT